jgi:O-acetyl-ADP-ribose deacetylase (regulator of RNase III)
LAQKKKFRTIAFPSISTGAYGFPIERASRIALREIINHLKENPQLEKVVVVCFDKKTHECYSEALEKS